MKNYNIIIIIIITADAFVDLNITFISGGSWIRKTGIDHFSSVCALLQTVMLVCVFQCERSNVLDDTEAQDLWQVLTSSVLTVYVSSPYPTAFG